MRSGLEGRGGSRDYFEDRGGTGSSFGQRMPVAMHSSSYPVGLEFPDSSVTIECLSGSLCNPEHGGDLLVSLPWRRRKGSRYHLFASFRSWLKIACMGGRLEGFDLRSVSQETNKRFHNVSENPEEGRLDFFPLTTQRITVGCLIISSKGRLPVNTYQGCYEPSTFKSGFVDTRTPSMVIPNA